MRKKRLICLLLPLFAALSFPLQAAPALSENTSHTTSVSADQAPSEATKVKIDINSASVDMLNQGLHGIGKAKAQAIVAYREEHGKFASVDELLEVKGIGSLLLDRNRDKLTVD